nr:protein STRUBBELIG-RECEPTOR FAMILY 8 [Ipomoea batatas]
MKMVKGISLLVSVIMAWILGLGFVRAATDPMDLQALEVIYTSLNSPSQLTGWKANGGDPCSESWKGVVCQGSDVVSIEISGLGLNGTLGYMLNGLKSLKTLDMSSNSIHDSIPYQLPPNLTSLNLAYNNLSGSLPYSINDMILINYLNLSSNSLYQSIGDVFTNHSDLETLDLSFNKFSGDLPPSLSSLPKLSTL